MARTGPNAKRKPKGDADTGRLRILRYAVPQTALRRLSDRERNLITGCMHAHNELATLNRLLLFSMTATSEGAAHDTAQAVQMWCLMQLVAGKVFETWEMLCRRVVEAKPEDPLLTTLSTAHRTSLDWLVAYFGKRTSYKPSAVKFVRDTTAFHYGSIDLGQAVKNLGSGEDEVYLAQHPANSLYYLGSALVFRSLFAEIAAKRAPAPAADHGARVAQGFTILIEDLREANFHLHRFLYALIKALLERAAGGDLDATDMTEFTILNAPAPKKVGIPTWIDLVGPPAASEQIGEKTAPPGPMQRRRRNTSKPG